MIENVGKEEFTFSLCDEKNSMKGVFLDPLQWNGGITPCRTQAVEKPCFSTACQGTSFTI